MKKKMKMTNRHTLSAAIILFYFIPLVLFAFYSIGLMSADKSWGILSSGLLLITGCSLILILTLYYWEKSLRNELHSSPAPLLAFSSSSDEEKTIKMTLEPGITFAHNPDQEEDSEEVNDSEPESSNDPSKETNLLYTTLKESQEQLEKLQQILEEKIHASLILEEEKEQLYREIQQVTQDFADYKLFSEEQLKQKQLQLNNLQQIAEDQRMEMEKRQEQIHQLDTKIHDLSYEIKTLLYLHEEDPSHFKPSQSQSESKKEEKHFSQSAGNKHESVVDIHEKGILITEIFSSEGQIRTSKEASLFLKKCIQIAEKLTGATHYSNESTRYREFSSSYYTIDQRRLFDSLRNEGAAVITVCAPKEQKILFVNNQVKSLLGWNPEKFISDFPLIMQEGIHEWNKALSQLGTYGDSQTRLLAKSKEGKELLLNCHFGIIPTGLFRNYVIGILYPT